MRTMYSFRVWDALRDGVQVYAVAMDKQVPYLVDLSEKTVAQVTEFMREHSDEDCLYIECAEVEE